MLSQVEKGCDQALLMTAKAGVNPIIKTVLYEYDIDRLARMIESEIQNKFQEFKKHFRMWGAKGSLARAF